MKPLRSADRASSADSQYKISYEAASQSEVDSCLGVLCSMSDPRCTALLNFYASVL
jgi:hypothetical protein